MSDTEVVKKSFFCRFPKNEEEEEKKNNFSFFLLCFGFAVLRILHSAPLTCATRQCDGVGSTFVDVKVEEKVRKIVSVALWKLNC